MRTYTSIILLALVSSSLAIFSAQSAQSSTQQQAVDSRGALHFINAPY